MDPGATRPLKAKAPNTLQWRDGLLLIGLWLLGVLMDGLWIHQHREPPSWDQGDHLSRALGIWQVLQAPTPWQGAWWQQLWAQAPSYRGPLSYLAAVPLFQWLGPTYQSAMASNGLLNGVLLLSTYGLGRQVHGRCAGLWAACLVALAPALLDQRTSFLIDLSLTAALNSCWWLLSQRRWWGQHRPWLWSLLSGAGLAVVFLMRPTGLVFLWLPLLLIGIRGCRELGAGRWQIPVQTAAATGLAITLVWPWFSQNWLTILSTINNARQWGVQYQDGLEATSLEGWLYYPRLLPAMAGSSVVALVLAGSAVAAISNRRRGHSIGLLKTGVIHPRGWWLWWLSFPLGGLLVCVVMSTKDFRFVLPLMPQLCLALGLLVARVQQPWAPLWRGALIAVALQAALWNQFGWGLDLSGFPPHRPKPQGGWPVQAIVSTIRLTSPHQLSTLAVLPDSAQLNAFNIEAEGRRQDVRVAARQTVGRRRDAQANLSRFDWFLSKSGDQGVMSGQRQAQEGRLLKSSGAFVTAGQWSLPDGSRAELHRRRELSVEVQEQGPCSTARISGALRTLPGGLELKILGPAQSLQGIKLLVDLRGPNGVLRADQALGQGLLRTQDLPRDRCIAVSQRLAVIGTEARQGGGPYVASVQLLDSSRQVKPLALAPSQPLRWATAPEPAALAENRVVALESLGAVLRDGQFDSLFDQIGLLNQSDPEQVYLADGEAILRARLHRNPGNLNDRYALALAQALQRQAGDAALSLQELHRLDPGNPNPLIGLGVVELYRFRPWAAQAALDQAATITAPDAPIAATLRTLRIAASALRLDLRQALSLLQP